MRFELRRAFADAEPLSSVDQDLASAGDLPSEIAFLRAYHVDYAVLQRAARHARQNGVCAARALIAEGSVSAALYYRALAHYLDRPFMADWPQIEPIADLTAAHLRGCIRLAGAAPARWLAAPCDGALRLLLEARAQGLALPNIAITTPYHLSAIIRHRAEHAVEHAATFGLPDAAPHLSARRAVNRKAVFALILLVAGCPLGLWLLPQLMGDLLGPLFLAGIIFRSVVGAAGLTALKTAETDLAETALPFYSVLVPLHRETGVIPRLVAGLRALDYPTSKLEIIFLVEPEDKATRGALAALRLPPWFRVVVAPDEATLRTKPRALNIGLMVAHGTLLTVFDAEDLPEPGQLRRAAARFASAPETLACLQARLAMENGDAGLLPRLFAIEYAALFDLYNAGTAAFGLPFALGGTSNHFRVPILRKVGGWDAWNVTEDADLGLRLARLGYQVGALDSTTFETAPTSLSVWMKQRRRWLKGWMQTFLVIAKSNRAIGDWVNWTNAAIVLMSINLILGPLLLSSVSIVVIYHLIAFGLPHPQHAFEAGEAALAVSVLSYGVISTLGMGYAGMRARGLLRFLPALPLLLPYQLLISVAAVLGLFDLVRRPFHWHKTPH